MVYTIVLVLTADSYGLLWWRGIVETVSKSAIYTLHFLIFAGITSSIATGVLLAQPTIAYWLTQPEFLLKIFFLFTLLINSIIINHHLKLATTHSFQSLDRNQQTRLLASAFVSTISWVSIVMISLFFLQS